MTTSEIQNELIAIVGEIQDKQLQLQHLLVSYNQALNLTINDVLVGGSPMTSIELFNITKQAGIDTLFAQTNQAILEFNTYCNSVNISNLTV